MKGNVQGEIARHAQKHFRNLGYYYWFRRQPLAIIFENPSLKTL